ncbi:hypothetical protein GCM10008967_16750 [Bacillus carboniphilus]|uniref:Uncharacterized protein n=1 Tax=Bacillus carboniphilus TaxID=86663 RepID=A0ABN0W6J9_9BACI
MEKAMQQAHGIGYEVYSQKHEIRMKVERKREKDYIQSQRIVMEHDRKLFS